MPDTQHHPSWTSAVFAKILYHLIEVAPEKPKTKLAAASGRTGSLHSDFAVFKDPDFDLGQFIALMMFMRASLNAEFDIFGHKAITVVRSHLQSGDLTKAIRIAAPADRYLDCDLPKDCGPKKRVHLRMLEGQCRQDLMIYEFSLMLSTGEPIVYLTDMSQKHESQLPLCPRKPLTLGPVDHEIISLALGFEFGGEAEAEHPVLAGCDFTHVRPFDLVCACRAEDRQSAIQFLMDLPQTRYPDDDEEDDEDLLPDIPPSVADLDDLAGYGEAKVAAQDLLDALSAYQSGELEWSDVPRGLLLIGPPGTGKTELGRAMSRTVGVSFVASSYSEWQAGGHLGDFMKSMKRTFEEAKSARPTVLFLDELDAFHQSDGRHSSYDLKATKGLLEQLDGIRGREGVIVVGAANEFDKIPPALRRSGRFDTIATIPLPCQKDLAVIVGQHLRSVDDDIDVEACAVQAMGRTGADCAAAIRKGRATARRNRRKLITTDILEALAGRLHNMPPDVLLRMAIHECGDALVGHSYPELTVEYLRLSEDGGECRTAGQGMVHTSATLHRDRTVLLAGRMAEILVLGEPSSGAGGASDSDLAKVLRSAANEIGAYGLGQNGPLWLGPSNSEVLIREVIQGNLPEVSALIAAADKEARCRLQPQLFKMAEMARAVLETGVLTGERLSQLLSQAQTPDTAA
ncbi:hypothetical protein BFP70_13690 [Thioclava sp. SK-1]|uniref:AAA family ATPase n=1 Tax=Thioclava sp. SK-1 TaxID=1889770 RepID=UPI0008266039|nr:AAA family ATPase [Thioclava sp. SK-1]OCX62535.1 hypothetical protein BFP70_13690 [Thioclava sp. SK-1]